MKTITINHDTFERLKVAYTEAVNDNKEQFTFEESELLTKFAKYLLEHMENELKLK